MKWPRVQMIIAVRTIYKFVYLYHHKPKDLMICLNGSDVYIYDRRGVTSPCDKCVTIQEFLNDVRVL